MIKVFTDEETVKKCDPKIKAFETAYEYNPNALIIRARMQGNLVVSDREIHIFMTHQQLPDGTRVSVGCSVDSDKVTFDPSCVVGKVDMWCYHFEEVSDSKCKVTAMTLVNPGGSIPTALVNTMVGARHTQFVNFKNAAESS